MTTEEKIYSEFDIAGMIGTISRKEAKKQRALKYGEYKDFDKYLNEIEYLEKKLFSKISANIAARLTKQDA